MTAGHVAVAALAGVHACGDISMPGDYVYCRLKTCSWQCQRAMAVFVTAWVFDYSDSWCGNTGRSTKSNSILNVYREAALTVICMAGYLGLWKGL